MQLPIVAIAAPAARSVTTGFPAGALPMTDGSFANIFQLVASGVRNQSVEANVAAVPLDADGIPPEDDSSDVDTESDQDAADVPSDALFLGALAVPIVPSPPIGPPIVAAAVSGVPIPEPTTAAAQTTLGAMPVTAGSDSRFQNLMDDVTASAADPARKISVPDNPQEIATPVAAVADPARKAPMARAATARHAAVESEPHQTARAVQPLDAKATAPVAGAAVVSSMTEALAARAAVPMPPSDLRTMGRPAVAAIVPAADLDPGTSDADARIAGAGVVPERASQPHPTPSNTAATVGRDNMQSAPQSAPPDRFSNPESAAAARSGSPAPRVPDLVSSPASVPDVAQPDLSATPVGPVHEVVMGLNAAGDAVSLRPQTPLLAQHVAQQLAVTMRHTADRATEIALDPVELGKVRMTIKTHDQAIVLSVVADRPETADLMRRHVDVLQQEFRALGYTSLTMEFSTSQGQTASGNDGNARPGTSGEERAAEDIMTPDAAVAAPADIALGADGSLDLRL